MYFKESLLILGSGAEQLAAAAAALEPAGPSEPESPAKSDIPLAQRYSEMCALMTRMGQVWKASENQPTYSEPAPISQPAVKPQAAKAAQPPSNPHPPTTRIVVGEGGLSFAASHLMDFLNPTNLHGAACSPEYHIMKRAWLPTAETIGFEPSDEALV